ncbi:MAG: hypothetical protein MRJ92_09890 [Nitrospira sp.]|nr:hypothetical protein [Nitrospira sp.]
MSGFGWNATAVDGHDIGALLAAFRRGGGANQRPPTVLLAKTFKGRAFLFEEQLIFDGTETAEEAAKKPRSVDELTRQLNSVSVEAADQGAHCDHCCRPC